MELRFFFFSRKGTKTSQIAVTGMLFRVLCVCALVCAHVCVRAGVYMSKPEVGSRCVSSSVALYVCVYHCVWRSEITLWA